MKEKQFYSSDVYVAVVESGMNDGFIPRKCFIRDIDLVQLDNKIKCKVSFQIPNEAVEYNPNNCFCWDINVKSVNYEVEQTWIMNYVKQLGIAKIHKYLRW